MSLDSSLTVEASDAAVEFAFTVENPSIRAVELEFPSGKITDFVVYRGREETWRWSDDRMFTQARHRETLAPGESFTQTASWGAPSPGEYTVEATLETTDPLIVERADFAIPPPDGL